MESAAACLNFSLNHSTISRKDIDAPTILAVSDLISRFKAVPETLIIHSFETTGSVAAFRQALLVLAKTAIAADSVRTLELEAIFDNESVANGFCEFVCQLLEHTALESLRLYMTDIFLKDASGLAAALRKSQGLKSFELTAPTRLSDEACKRITRAAVSCIPLRELRLINNVVNGEIAAETLPLLLSKRPSLRSLDLSGSYLDLDDKAFSAGICALVELKLNDNPDISDQAVKSIVIGCRVLSVLDLRSCTEVTDVGAGILAGAMRNKWPITELRLDQTKIGDVGTKKIAEALRGNKRLVKLGMGRCGITLGGAESIVNAMIEHNRVLRSLHICHNNLGASGARLISLLMCKTRTLNELCAASNAWNAGDIAEVAKGLAENASLTKLNLSGNAINQKATEALVKVLRGNRTLARLNLKSEAFTDECACAVSAAVGEIAIRQLRLSTTQVGAKGRACFKDAMQMHPQFKVYYV